MISINKKRITVHNPATLSQQFTKGIWVCEEDVTAQMLQFCADNAIAADVEVVPSSEMNTARPPVSRRCRSIVGSTDCGDGRRDAELRGT